MTYSVDPILEPEYLFSLRRLPVVVCLLILIISNLISHVYTMKN